jgi:hypothetical protein
MAIKTMRYTALLAVVVLALVALAAMTTGAASAQDPSPVPITPPSCRSMAKYDLTGDGKVNSDDFGLWVRIVHESGEVCRLNGPLGNCPSFVDIDGDGMITHADLDALTRFMVYCVWPTRTVRPQ